MKKWEELQLTVDTSEEGQGNFQDKTQKLFKTMKVGLMREFDLWNVFNEGLYEVRFIECPSYQESTVFINLVFSLFVVISYGKNRLQRHLVRKCK